VVIKFSQEKVAALFKRYRTGSPFCRVCHPFHSPKYVDLMVECADVHVAIVTKKALMWAALNLDICKRPDRDTLNKHELQLIHEYIAKRELEQLPSLKTQLNRVDEKLALLQDEQPSILQDYASYTVPELQEALSEKLAVWKDWKAQAAEVNLKSRLLKLGAKLALMQDEQPSVLQDYATYTVCP
jgi:hypothetical protein